MVVSTCHIESNRVTSNGLYTIARTPSNTWRLFGLAREKSLLRLVGAWWNRAFSLRSAPLWMDLGQNHVVRCAMPQESVVMMPLTAAMGHMGRWHCCILCFNIVSCLVQSSHGFQKQFPALQLHRLHFTETSVHHPESPEMWPGQMRQIYLLMGRDRITCAAPAERP